MKKVLVVGNTAWIGTFRTILANYAEVETVFCEYSGDLFATNGAWSRDPLDAFLDFEPALVLIQYETHHEEKGYWWRPWKEMVGAMTPVQKILRFGWMASSSTKWVPEGCVVRERTPDEAAADYIRLPPDPEAFRKLITG